MFRKKEKGAKAHRRRKKGSEIENVIIEREIFLTRTHNTAAVEKGRKRRDLDVMRDGLSKL